MAHGHYVPRRQNRTRTDHIDVNQLDADKVASFLTYLERECGNTLSTRNSRLCAIRAVLADATPGHLERAETISCVLAVPPKSHPKPMLEYLSTEKYDVLITAPGRAGCTGRRDHALLVLAIHTGCVSASCVPSPATTHTSAPGQPSPAPEKDAVNGHHR